MSALATANIDGEQLTPAELASFFILLVVAGNETTRNAISRALVLFTRHPDQRSLLLSDPDSRLGPAVEEIVRYVSPVIRMRRTLTADTVMNGHPYQAGDKVLLVYQSANRDPAVFPDADRFDITRSPNPHVGFGAAGPHFCLGAHLARREITAIWRELLTRAPDIRASGEPEYLLSSFINGIKRLPASAADRLLSRIRISRIRTGACCASAAHAGQPVDVEEPPVVARTRVVPVDEAAVLGGEHLAWAVSGGRAASCAGVGRPSHQEHRLAGPAAPAAPPHRAWSGGHRRRWQ